MLDAHAGIGMALLIGFAALVIINFMRMRGDGAYAWAQYISYAVSALLLLQYVIGFQLLADEDHDITALHYILALAVILPVGAEHMMKTELATPKHKARVAMFANIAALVIVVIVYSIGERN